MRACARARQYLRSVYTSEAEYIRRVHSDRVLPNAAVTTCSARNRPVTRRGGELMPLANDNASAAARGRHVVSVGVATRSSNISSSSSSDSSTYSPPAGHPRARESAPSSSSSYHLLLPRHLHAARRYPTHRAGCCSRGMILRIPSSLPGPPSVATRRPENQTGASTPLLADRPRYASRHSRFAPRRAPTHFGDYLEATPRRFQPGSLCLPRLCNTPAPNCRESRGVQRPRFPLSPITKTLV